MILCRTIDADRSFIEYGLDSLGARDVPIVETETGMPDPEVIATTPPGRFGPVLGGHKPRSSGGTGGTAVEFCCAASPWQSCGVAFVRPRPQLGRI